MSEFEAGQVWRYDTRPEDRGSLCEILKVERDDDERIVHVRLTGLGMAHDGLAGGVAHEIDHLPLTWSALEASVTERAPLQAGAAGNLEAYYHWREAYELGDAGVFTLRLKDIVATIEAGLGELLADDADDASPTRH